MTTQRKLAERLCDSISSQEWHVLETGEVEGGISEHNRAALLRLRTCDRSEDEIADDDIASMEALLERFLEEHLPGRPAAARWITTACLALAFVLREPLHPVDLVGAECRMNNGHVQWRCPINEGAGTLCAFCPCEPQCH